jgi:hypothetical protein
LIVTGDETWESTLGLHELLVELAADDAEFDEEHALSTSPATLRASTKAIGARWRRNMAPL